MMIFRRYIITILVLLVHLCSYASGREWSASDVPIPYLKDSTQYVSDPDGYVPQELKDSANCYLRNLNVQCGVQNVVIIVGHVADHDAFRMAQDVGNKYGIGYKKSNRGLVVVIAVEDKKYFIAPGGGLEGELTDVDCDDIARACIVKNMREGNPGEAVFALSRAIYNKVKSGKTGITDIDEGTVYSDEDWALAIIIFTLIFGLPIYFLVRLALEKLGIVKPQPQSHRRRRNRHDDDWFPPFFMGGGGGFSSGNGYSGGGFSGGSFGGGSFSGGGAGGGW